MDVGLGCEIVELGNMNDDEIKSKLRVLYKSCRICPKSCGVDRSALCGACGIDAKPRIYQNFVHLGEECSIVPALVINMCGCNLSCPTCPERHRWSDCLPIEDATSYAKAIARFIEKHGNIQSLEWIGGEPSLQVGFAIETSWKLREILGTVPTMYLNSNMYFSTDLLPILCSDEAPSIDAFVYDLKCTAPCSRTITGAKDYYEIVTHNIEVATHLRPHAPHILRHLVMPGHLDCCTNSILSWCKEHIPNVCINLMTTFHDFRPNGDGPLFLSDAEKHKAIDMIQTSGIATYFIDGQSV